MKNRKLGLANSKKQKGSVAVEYMILVVFLGLVVATGAALLGGAISTKFTQLGSTVTGAQIPALPAAP